MDDYANEIANNPQIPRKFHLRKSGKWIREAVKCTERFKSEEELEQGIHNKLEEIRKQMDELKEEIHNSIQTDRQQAAWRNHVASMHVAGDVVSKLRSSLSDRDISKAYCKFMEIINYMPSLISPATSGKYRSFHLCEAPGQFILALDHFLSMFHPELDWHWDANTLNPHCESTPPDEMFLDDRVICAYPNNWHFGPSGTGDIFEWNQVIISENNCYDLVTADGSLYTRDNPAGQEKLVLDLLEKEAEIALSILNPGGTFIMKIYSMLDERSRKLIITIAECFEEVVIFKPHCSKPRTSERYLICRGFLRTADLTPSDQIKTTLLLECELYFSKQQFLAAQYYWDNNGNLKDNKVCAQKKIAKDAILQNIRADLMKNKIRWSLIQDRAPQPWIAMFGDNYIEEIKKLDSVDSTKTFIKETLINEALNLDNTGGEEIEMEWGEDYQRFLSDVNQEDVDSLDTILSFGKDPISIKHSLFIPPLWLRSSIIMDETEPERPQKIVDLCSLSNRGEANNRFDEKEGILYIDCSSIESKKDWIKLLQDIKLAAQKLTSLQLEWNGPGLPLILSRFSASVIAFMSMFFFKIKFGEGSLIMTFSEPHYEEDIHSQSSAFLSMLHDNCDNVVQFIPFSMFAELHADIEAFNRRQWKRSFRSLYLEI